MFKSRILLSNFLFVLGLFFGFQSANGQHLEVSKDLEILVDTGPGGNAENFVEISIPIVRDGRVFFKAYELNEDGKQALPGIYEITENGYIPFFPKNTRVPGTKEVFESITSFDIEDGKMVFVGWAHNKLTMGVYLFDGENVTTITDVNRNIPRRTLRWNVLNEVFLLNGEILFTGGREDRDGLFRFDGEKVQIVAHNRVEYWRHKKIKHKTVRSISIPLKAGNELIFASHIKIDGILYPYLYKYTGSEVFPFYAEGDARPEFSGGETIRSMTGGINKLVFAIDNEDQGSLRTLVDGEQMVIADNSLSLWPAENLKFEAQLGTNLNPGDALKPAPEMEFKKYTNNFPFWQTVFSLYELEGIIQPYYVNRIYLGEEVVPIRPQRKRGELWGNIGAAIGAGIAAALTGGTFIAPAQQNQTRFQVLAQQANLQGFDAGNISWSNYFQGRLSIGFGGFSGDADEFVFHAANLNGRQGLFKYSEGKYKKLIDDNDTLNGKKIENLYLGFSALQRETIWFWAELEEPGENESSHIIVRAYPKPENPIPNQE